MVKSHRYSLAGFFDNSEGTSTSSGDSCSPLMIARAFAAASYEFTNGEGGSHFNYLDTNQIGVYLIILLNN